MSLDRMFTTVEGLRETAAVNAAFGEPQEVEGRILIPVAEVHRGFGMGFGEGTTGEGTTGEGTIGEGTTGEGTTGEGEQEGEQPPGSEGGGAGGGAGARPIAVIEVTPAETVVKPIVDETKVALAGIALIGWIAFWVSATLRSIFGQS